MLAKLKQLALKIFPLHTFLSPRKIAQWLEYWTGGYKTIQFQVGELLTEKCHQDMGLKRS